MPLPVIGWRSITRKTSLFSRTSPSCPISGKKRAFTWIVSLAFRTLIETVNRARCWIEVRQISRKRSRSSGCIADNSFNTFFGVKYKSRIDAVMNIEPSDLKFYTNWSVESNAKWQNPYVRVANSRAFREIESFTPDGKIVRRQGVFYAPFMFDTNTPNVANPVINGNKLVGETLLLRLENKAPIFPTNLIT